MRVGTRVKDHAGADDDSKLAFERPRLCQVPGTLKARSCPCGQTRTGLIAGAGTCGANQRPALPGEIADFAIKRFGLQEPAQSHSKVFR